MQMSELLNRTPPEPGTVGAEMSEAFEAFKKTELIPDSVSEPEAYDAWEQLPEVRRYRRIK